MNDTKESNLVITARELRRLMANMIYKGDAGHIGGSLSATEIMTVLYFEEMRIDLQNPQWAQRDRFVLSKGHCSPVIYATLALKGYFPIQWLDEFSMNGSPLQKHPDMKKVPGIDISSGSLAQGLSVASGMAWAVKKKGWDSRVYALLGDGELQEGQIWEAAMFAAHQKLDNLVAIVDRNLLQIDGTTEEICSLEPLSKKWEAFGWFTQTIDGHDISAILAAFAKAKTIKGSPSVIISKTIKGKGFSLTENRLDSHHRAFNKEEYEKAISELKEVYR
jgi:transketolase